MRRQFWLLQLFLSLAAFSAASPLEAKELKLESAGFADANVGLVITTVTILADTRSGHFVRIQAEGRGASPVSYLCESGNLGSLVAAEALARAVENASSVICVAENIDDRTVTGASAVPTRQVSVTGVGQIRIVNRLRVSGQ